MADASLGKSEFLTAYCNACAEDVLASIGLGLDGSIEYQCAVCDEVLEAGFRVVHPDDLEGLGYTLIEAKMCGNGGGCSGGSCRSRSAG